MPCISQRPIGLKLSICITTFNRVGFIGETLESILSQTTDECEVVVLDGGSTDRTADVLAEYSRRFKSLRYVRQATNGGFDRDCDRAVELAAGKYCWLMSDDDLLKPGAVEAVLKVLDGGVSLLIVNGEVRDRTMSKVIQPNWLDFKSDRLYDAGEVDRLVMDVGHVLTYVGCIIVAKAIWVSRERQQYFGSLFIPIGVIFHERFDGKALAIAQPLISYRSGNTHTFSPKMFETFRVNLPVLVSTLDLSELAKRKISSPEPWKDLWELLFWRALGFYSLTEWRRLIRPRVASIREALPPALVALLPGGMVNGMFVLYYLLGGRFSRGPWQSEVRLQALRESRFHVSNWRMFRRVFHVRRCSDGRVGSSYSRTDQN